MSDFATQPEQHTVGGGLGHWLRRTIHVAMILAPVLYYHWGAAIGAFFHAPIQIVMLGLVGLIAIVDIVRIAFGAVFFAQRDHEAHQIASLTWGAIAVAVVLLFAPGRATGIPIIVSCALADPALGELRRRVSHAWVSVVVGVLLVASIWWVCALWWPTPWWYPMLLAPVTILGEWPCFHWIDDNALMQFLPLLLVLLID